MGKSNRRVGLFEMPLPPPSARRQRTARRRPTAAQRLIPGDAAGERAFAEQAARRRHPSARRTSRPVAVADVRSPSVADDSTEPASSVAHPPAPSPPTTAELRLAR